MLCLLLALLQPPPPAVPFDTPAVDDFEALRKKAEPLPDPPKLLPANKLVPVSPETKDRLLVEVAGGKPARVLVAGEVCLIRGPLEVLLTRKNTKEHESILRTDVDARLIHQALLTCGGKPGSPARFVNDKGEDDYKPATGSPVAVGVHYRLKGKLLSHPAGEWVKDLATDKPLTKSWVFAGSRLLKNEDRPDAPPFYTANSGEVVSLANFPDAMLDVPVKLDKFDPPAYQAWTEKIPPLFSGVWVTLEPGK